MTYSGPNLRDGTTTVQRMAYEGVPSMMDGQFRQTFWSEAFARDFEPLPQISAVERIAESIAVLGAHEASIVARPLFAAKALPIAEIVERALVPGQRNLAGLVAFGDFLADANLRSGAVYLHVGQNEASDLGGAEAHAARQPEDDPVHSTVQRATTPPSEIGQNEPDFIRLEDFGFIDGPSCHCSGPFMSGLEQTGAELTAFLYLGQRRMQIRLQKPGNAVKSASERTQDRSGQCRGALPKPGNDRSPFADIPSSGAAAAEETPRLPCTSSALSRTASSLPVSLNTSWSSRVFDQVFDSPVERTRIILELPQTKIARVAEQAAYLSRSMIVVHVGSLPEWSQTDGAAPTLSSGHFRNVTLRYPELVSEIVATPTPLAGGQDPFSNIGTAIVVPGMPPLPFEVLRPITVLLHVPSRAFLAWLTKTVWIGGPWVERLMRKLPAALCTRLHSMFHCH